jgi:hypothetical protein
MDTPDTPSRQIGAVSGPPDVEIIPARVSLSISGGQSVQAQFTVQVFNAEGPADGTAVVGAASLPAGITAELSPQSVEGQGDVTLTLTAAPDVAPTVATVIVSATVGPHASRSLVTLDVVATGQITPKYQLLTVLYAPPGTNGGNSSSLVQYTSESSTGTTASIDSSFQAGVDVTASVGDGLGSTDFSASQTTDNSSSVSITKTTSDTITVNGPAQDGIDHGDDLFVLWLNPLLNVTIDDHVTWEIGVDGPEMVIQNVFASWLQNPGLMPPGTAQALADAGLTTADYEQILAATRSSPETRPSTPTGSCPSQPPSLTSPRPAPAIRHPPRASR